VQFRERHAGIAFEPFHVGAMLPLCGAIIFLEFLVVRARDLRFQVTELAVQRVHDLRGFIHPIRQVLAL